MEEQFHIMTYKEAREKIKQEEVKKILSPQKEPNTITSQIQKETAVIITKLLDKLEENISALKKEIKKWKTSTTKNKINYNWQSIKVMITPSKGRMLVQKTNQNILLTRLIILMLLSQQMKSMQSYFLRNSRNNSLMLSSCGILGCMEYKRLTCS